MAEPATAIRSRTGSVPGRDVPREEQGPDAARCLGMYAKLSAGVCVVTAPGEDGPLGLTVSAVTSLSARPPLLLVCLRNGSGTLAAIRASGSFAVHLLREEQQRRAAVFADPAATAAQRFAGTDVQQVLGVPVFGDALGWSVCRIEDVRRYGDHHLVVGRVAAVEVGTGKPLLWHDRQFRALAAGSAGCAGSAGSAAPTASAREGRG